MMYLIGFIIGSAGLLLLICLFKIVQVVCKVLNSEIRKPKEKYGIPLKRGMTVINATKDKITLRIRKKRKTYTVELLLFSKEQIESLQKLQEKWHGQSGIGTE